MGEGVVSLSPSLSLSGDFKFEFLQTLLFFDPLNSRIIFGVEFCPVKILSCCLLKINYLLSSEILNAAVIM